MLKEVVMVMTLKYFSIHLKSIQQYLLNASSVRGPTVGSGAHGIAVVLASIEIVFLLSISGPSHSC